MIHYILAGEEAVNHFQEENWAELQGCVLMENSGDIFSFDYSNLNPISELLEQLRGWNNYIELSEEDMKDIEKNTLIEIERTNNVKLPIYWSTSDFEGIAEKNFKELKEEHPEEFLKLENWEQLYDKTKFPEALAKMIRHHDATIGITWLTVEEYLSECEIKQN